MILPISESQLRTYLDTGQVTVELPSDCKWRADVEPKEHSEFPGLWMPYCSDGRVANGEPGDTDDSYEITAPVKVGDRVAIGEEWRMPRWDDDHGVGIYYRDEEFRWHRPSDHVEFAREYLSRKWYPADTMPEWAARHFATVATVAFERRGDRWAWFIGLEADSAD